MKSGVVLGVDGGNTKTVAVVATPAGDVLGTGLGTCSDIYGAPSPQEALEVLVGVVREALAEAGVSPSEVAATVGSLAGADWPEDYELYHLELSRRAGLSGRVKVLNDGVGPVRLAEPSGTGVAAVLGTGAAVGARGRSGDVWHGSFWLPVGGAGWLGQQALAAVYRATLGIGPPTSLTQTLLDLFAEADEEALLHSLTQRRVSPRSPGWEGAAGSALLDADARGDAVARDIIAKYAAQLAPYVMVAAQKVSLEPSFSVVLTGGLLRHPTSTLARCLVDDITALAPQSRVLRSIAPPVAGAVLEAIALSGCEVTGSLVEAVVGSGLLAPLGVGPDVSVTGPPLAVLSSPATV